MRTLLFAALILAAGPAAAKECYQLDEDPDWTITVNEPGADPEWWWKRGADAEPIGVTTTGAGTGVPTRVAWPDEDDAKGARYMFYKDALIVDMDVYEPVACKD